MKANKKTVKKLSFIIIAIALLVISVSAVMVSASDGIEVVGEMVDIKNNFDAGYLVQDTARASDNYVGDYQYTVYYDQSKGDVKTSYFGTPVIVYTINHPAIERIGTDSNEKIIKSMLDDGYVVIVVDYLGNYDAVGYNLEISVQKFRYKVYNGDILTNTDVFPSGLYRENFLVPSGYNVLLNQVFWELDKHSVDGTFEQIVANWNSDFRATKGSKLVYWMHEDGTRKSVQNDFDGNSPVWYDADGNVDENGEYTYIKYTKAEVITDCVDPDGSFLDTELRIHIVYPTSPENKVPVMAHACSSGYLHSAPTDDSAITEKGQLAPHFVLDGYAYALFDYLWQPMGRNTSWGYYDGAQGVSKDHMNYSLHIYNDKLVNTAAMRFIRYTSLKGGDTYKFDLDKIGVFGNSKGGWFNFLGEKAVQSSLVDAAAYNSTDKLEDAIVKALEAFTSERTYNGYHGTTRYNTAGNASFTADGITLAAGEKQPWLTYEGKEIISGCQITIPENGGSAIDITEGHMPIFVTSNMTDYLNAQYGVTLDIYNICRELDIPMLHLELPIGHALPTGKDINYNVDSTDIVARYANYYLKNKAISVAYVVPMDNAGNVDATDKITIAFVGQAELNEVKKISVTASDGTEVLGTWESSFGKVVWTFTPDSLSGGTEYTVTVPAGFAGTNGTAMEKAYTTSFITEFGKETKPESVSENVYTFVAPEFTTGNSFVFRFNVKNDAANVAEVYADSTDGEKLGSVNLRGAGSYDIDITDYVAANAGKEITLVLKAGRTAGNTQVKSDALSGETVADVTLNKTNASFTYGSEIGDRNALGASLDKAYNYNYSKYYNNPTKILTYYNVTGGEAVTKDDLGRLYTFSVDVYDTVERTVQFRLRSMTDKTGHQTIDYDNVRLNFKTVANKWTTYTFTYRVYESDYGSMSVGKAQYLEILASPDGDTASPIYISNLVVTENVTDIDVSNAVIAETKEGSFDYSAPVSTYPFAIYNGETLVGEYDGWAAVLAAYTSGYTIKLQSDYTFTDADVSNKLGSFDVVNLDLGNYTITLANTANSLIWIKATNKTTTEVNITGGMLLIGDTPIVSYGSAATTGSGKYTFVNFTGVEIGLAEGSMATELISDTEIATSVVLKSKISFTDCKFDLPDSKRVYDAATVLPTASSIELDLKYALQGGSISLTSERWLTILENTNSVQFSKDTNGIYTKLIMPKSYTYPLTGSYFTENGYASYVATSEESNLVTYTFAISENSTKYGVIPDDYMGDDNVTTYPFILFKDGSFVSAHKSISGASNAARDLMSAAGCEDETAYILLRANHKTTGSTPEFGISRGTIVFDLDGHTLTRGEAAFVGETLRESYPTSYTTSIVFKNGRLETSKSSMFVINNFYSTNSTKYYDFTFENVTFGSASGATALNQAIWLSSWINSNNVTTINTKITLRDCTFDLKTNRPSLSSTATLFTLGTYESVFDLVIEGGTIIGDGSKVKIASIDKYDTLTLAPNAKGEYLKFIPNDENSTAPNISNFNFDDGKYRTFILNEETGEYLLSEGGVETPYGTIPAEYADVSDYPFVFFVKEDGSYVCKDSATSSDLAFAYTNWKNATTALPNFTSVYNDVVILMRRDYSNTTEESTNGAMNSVDGKLTLDLGGYSLLSKKALAFTAFSADYKNRSGDIVIKNGTLLAKEKAISTNNKNDKQSVTKFWNILFEDVTFGFAEGATVSQLWINYDNSGSAVYDSTLTLKNCTFDLNTNRPSNAFTIFNLSASSGSGKEFKYTLNIDGGTVLCDDLTGVTFCKYNDGNDVINFNKNENGEYLRLITSTTEKNASHFNGEFVTGSGKYFVEMLDDGITSVYELTSLVTPYGTAPATAEYLSAVDYPFFVFQNGEFVSATENWKDAVKAALALVDETSEASLTAEIVMRRDYDIYKATEGSVNFNTARGTIIVDLGGYKITTVDGYFIDIAIKNASDTFLDYESRLIVRNGTLLNQRATLPCIGIGHSGASSSGKKKTLSFTFEDVTFKTTGYSIMRDWGHSGTTGLNVNVVFDNCIYDFDYHNGDNVMFHFNSGNARVVTNVQFIGGKIIASKIENYRLINNRSEDTVIFAKDENGNYTSLVQPTKYTSVAPKDTFINENGTTLTFVEEKADGYNTIYELIPAKPEIEFNLKTSITLGSELVYNVYVPVSPYLTSFTLDGEEYTDLSSIENVITLSDGNNYYLIPVALKAAEAARDVVLKVNLTVDKVSYSGTFTMSVPKYANKVINLEGSTDVEKTLVKDVLAYIKAAYTYFNGVDKELVSDEELATANAKIDAILGDYSNTFEKVAGNTNIGNGLYAAQLILEENPIIRFYLAEGKTKDAYTFKYGNTTLAYSKEGTAEFNGVTYNYVDISLYAYQLIGEISYTDGTNNGTYHINSYVDFVTTDENYKDNTNLITLVEKLYNYAKSAEAYRASVVGN